MNLKRITDAQIDAAIEAAMRKSIEREADPHDKARMLMELERWKRNEALPPERLAEMRLAVRDFLAALFPSPTVRRGRARKAHR